MFEMLYDLSDENLHNDINEKTIKYFPNNKADMAYFSDPNPVYNNKLLDEELKTTRITVNTLERVEIAIRESRYDNYLNDIDPEGNYNKMFRRIKISLDICVPLRFCKRILNKLETRMAKNLRNSFNGLLDLNTKENWNYGNNITAIIRMLSNSKLLTHAAMISSFSNAAQTLKDRTGKSPEEFESFIQSKELKHFDTNIFRNINIEEIEPYSIFLLQELSNISDDIIDFIHTLNYQEIRILEDTAVKLFAIIAFLDNQEDVLKIIAKLIAYYPSFKAAWPVDIKMMDFIMPVNNISNFFYQKLHSQHSNRFYLTFLNNSLNLFHKALIDEDIEYLADKHLHASLNDLEIVDGIFQSFLSLKFFVNSIGLDKITSIVKIIREDNKLNFDPLRRYWAMTSKKQVCLDGNSLPCKKNPHFDELNRLLWFSIKAPEHYLTAALKSILSEHRRAFQELINMVMPYIIIR